MISAVLEAWTQVTLRKKLLSAQEVARPLALSERLLVLAAAISVDYDYFRSGPVWPSVQKSFL